MNSTAEFTVGVVVPSWHYWNDPLKLQPLWELYYATLIEDRFPDASVDIIDLREDNAQPPVDDIPERDVYFYWVMKSADAVEVYDVVKKLKSRFPKSVHMAGGTHVDHHQDGCADVFDVVFRGTAEDLIVEALGNWREGTLQRRYASQTAFHFADYGYARRGFLPPDRIANNEHFVQHGGVSGTGVYFSRGCSFRCRFCVYNNPGKFEYRMPEQITAEINYLKSEFGVGGVNLRDEVCIPVNPKVAQGYLNAIGEGGVIWRGQTVPFAKEEMVKLAKESGCQELALGIESVDSDLVLEIADKPSKSIDNNRAFIELLKKYEIKVKVCLIMGLPGESRQVLERTISFLDAVQPDFVAVSGFDPVPGSAFYQDPDTYGIKSIDKDLSRHAHLLYRFGEEEGVGLPFEYHEEGPWGTALRRDEITTNLKVLQSYLRERGMSY